ncbi:MAG TPA: DNA ligase D [Bryobacteraceae bacterium]|nr:DNA ligase D [Bryobacteraceae bacterium]
MPSAIEPMKAEFAERPPRGADWLFEIKWDGVRALAFLDHEDLKLQARSGTRCDRQYPELAVLPHQVAATKAVLDGEIAVLDQNGVARFHLIQPRIMNADPNAIAHLARSTPVIYFAFDLLYLDGYDLRNAALSERRRLLEQIVTPNEVLRISEAFPGAGEELLAAAREHGLEGVVAKHATSRYESKRSREWLKIKVVSQQEFVIGGFTEPQGGRDYFGALVLGVYDEGAAASPGRAARPVNKLRWVGNVGTGFDRKLLATLYSRLEPLITKDCPFSERPKPDRGMTWVRPQLVCEVKFTEWTQDRRLRAPVFLGLRTDISAGEVREEPAGGSQEPEARSQESGVRNQEPGGGEMFGPSDKEVIRRINGHELKFTNLPKMFYPDDGYTKRDVLNYYAAIADLILPHLKDRPLSLKRYPNGVTKDYFFQKDAPETFAPWLRTELIESEHNHGPINYVFVDDPAGLLYLVNLGCIDHNPWMSRSPTLDNPDFILIDLDPQECLFEKIIDAALLVKAVLDQIGLTGYPKTTGGRGMHIYVPVEPVYSYQETRSFAEVIARLVFDQNPDLFTTPRSVSKRQKNRVYFDYLQNGKSKTIAAPYVLRAYRGAPVATPLEWSEVRHGLEPSQFHIGNARARFAEKGDLFAGVLQQPQRLETALPKLEKLFRRGAG